MTRVLFHEEFLDLCVRGREFIGADDVGLVVPIAARIADVDDHAILIAHLELTPLRHDLDRLAERILHGAHIALCCVDTFFGRGLIAALKLVVLDDVLLAAEIGQNPVAFGSRVLGFLQTTSEHGLDHFTSNSPARIHATALLVDEGAAEDCKNFRGLTINGTGHGTFSSDA